jgi:hypothetical protein
MLGALVKNAHPVVLAYGIFLRLYEWLATSLESDLDHVYGRRLCPSLMVYHVQLAIRDWLACQMDVAETECMSPPDFCQGLNLLELQNNLVWLPTTTNAPALLDLRVATQASSPVELDPAALAQEQAIVEPEQPPPLPSAQDRNPNRDARFGGNTPLDSLVRSRSVAQVITVAG